MERERLATLLQQEVVGRLHRADRGVKEANFSVLRKTSMPSALVETAFIVKIRQYGYLIVSNEYGGREELNPDLLKENYSLDRKSVV